MRGRTTLKSEVIEFHCNNYFDRAAIVRAGYRSGLECGTGFLWILHNRLKEEIWFLRYFLGGWKVLRNVLFISTVYLQVIEWCNEDNGIVMDPF